MDINNVRKTVRRMLRKRKISLSSFAAECGIEQASLWRFVNNKTGLSGENLLRLLARLEEDEVPQQ